MKVAHVVSTYPPYRGGMGQVAAAFVSGLRQRGVDAFAVIPSPRSDQAATDARTIRPWFRYGNAAFVPGLYAALADADIVHLHYPFFGGAEAVALRRALNPKQKLVVTYHMDVVGRGALAWFFGAYQATLGRWILSRADAITVSSHDYSRQSRLRNVLMAKHPLELPFGVEADFQPTSAVHSGPLHLLFVGGLDRAHYFKGVDLLLQALADHKQGDWSLDIIGDGDLRDGYVGQAQRLGLSDRVRFRGNIPRSELVAAYQQADVTLFPSRDASEAFGLVLVESMACGTPVFAANLPGVRTVVDVAKTGFLLPPNDVSAWSQQLGRLFAGQVDVSALRAASADRVNHLYRWPLAIDRLVALYGSL